MCQTDCMPGESDCCCEGSICESDGSSGTDGTCQATTCAPEEPCGSGCCPTGNCIAGACCSETPCVIGGIGGTPTCCPDTPGKTCIDPGMADASCAPCTKEDAPGWTTSPRVPACTEKGCECIDVRCCPGDVGQQPLCKPFPGGGNSQKIGSHKCACEVCDTDLGGIVCCPDGQYCSTPVGSSEECVPGPSGCETAFAIDEDTGGQNQRFCDTPDFNRWGWTNGPYTDGADEMLNIYAGAGQCETIKGTPVGTASVTVVGTTVTVTVTPAAMFQYVELHIQVSCDPLKYALQGTTETVAPGQYTYGDAFATSVVFVDGSLGTNEYKIDPTGQSTCTNGYWVIIHAVSCPL